MWLHKLGGMNAAQLCKRLITHPCYEYTALQSTAVLLLTAVTNMQFF